MIAVEDRVQMRMGGRCMIRAWKRYMKAFFACIFIGVVFVFYGCGGGDEFDTTSQPESASAQAERKGDAERKTPGGDKAKLAKQVWSYDPTGKRDPFEVPRESIDAEQEWPGIKYDLDQMWVDGIIWGAGEDVAHILLPGNQDIFVKVGDQLGLNQGRIKQITGNQVVVEEVYVDPANPSEIHIIEKMLEMAEGGKRKR